MNEIYDYQQNVKPRRRVMRNSDPYPPATYGEIRVILFIGLVLGMIATMAAVTTAYVLVAL